MEKIEKSEIILLLIIVVLAVFITFNLFKSDKVLFIDDHDYLYDKTIDYLLENDDNIDKDKDDYKMFITYKGFGIEEDKKSIYAYMWVVSESYYVEKNKLIKSTSNSIPCKFTFDKTSEEIIKYEITEEGNQHNISIKNMFPKNIQDEIINYEDDSDLQKEVDDYYNDIINK